MKVEVLHKLRPSFQRYWFVVYILAAYIDFNNMKLFFRKMTPD
jgi:hypothetical protein